MRVLFKNAKLILPTGIYPGEVLTCGEKIEKVCCNTEINERADLVIDVGWKYLSPGFIETHTHGAGGFDFMDGGLEAIYGGCRAQLIYGVTSILPTTITSTEESLLEFIKLFNQVDLRKEGCPNILGLHLEGPYFSFAQKGAQDPRFLRNPKPEEYLKILSLTDRIKRWSFAVELPGSEEFLTALREKGIVTSLAHSSATCTQVENAHQLGLKALTHFYSCMDSVTKLFYAE